MRTAHWGWFLAFAAAPAAAQAQVAPAAPAQAAPAQTAPTPRAPAAPRSTDRWLIPADTEAAYNAGNLNEASRLAIRDVKACLDSKPQRDECLTIIRFVAYIARDMGQPGMGEPFARGAVDLSEKFLAADDPDRARSYTALAEQLELKKSYDEAELYYRKAHEFRLRVLGESKEETALAALNLAQFLSEKRGDYNAATPLYEQAARIRRNVLGPTDLSTGYTELALAHAYKELGRFPDAEARMRAAIENLTAGIGRRDSAAPNGERDITAAAAIAGLANILAAQDRVAEAEREARRALELRLAVTGDKDPYVAFSYMQVAQLLNRQGRSDDALRMARESRRLMEANFGTNRAETAQAYSNLAGILAARREWEEVNELQTRSNDFYRSRFGENHPTFVNGLRNSGSDLMSQGRLDDALPVLRRALDLAVGIHGAESLNLLSYQIQLGTLLLKRGEFGPAAVTLRQAVALAERHLAPDHPELAAARALLGRALIEASVPGDAGLQLLRRAAQSVTERSTRLGLDPRLVDELRRAQGLFVHQVRAEWQGGRSTPSNLTAAFEAAQWAMINDASAALTKVAASFSRGGGSIATMETERQNKLRERAAAEQRYVQLIGSDDANDRRLRDEASKRRNALDLEIAGLEQRIGSSDPAYVDLTRPRALKLSEAQALLNADEAMLLTLTADDATYVFAVSKEKAEWVRVPELDGETLTLWVAAIRESMEEDLRRRTDTFNIEGAHLLYDQLIRPVESVLQGKQTLLTTSNSPLDGLPLHMLVTSKSESQEQSLSTTPFLIDRYAIATIPSVSSLLSLRCLLRTAAERHEGCPASAISRVGAPVRQTVDFFGIGNPTLAPVPAEPTPQSRSVPAYGRAFSGELADTEFLRALPSLPGSQAELQALGRLFNGRAATVRTGALATEASVKTSDDLARARYVVFSTHGLLADQSGRIGEPGLVFTPPPATAASTQDDGLLTASEAARLKFSADFLVLSACNTAASDGRAGEGLSGLARAFLFAGARSLLVSHWVVADDSTPALMEELFRLQGSDSANSAKALQSAIARVRKEEAWNSPAYWAPFTLIGVPN